MTTYHLLFSDGKRADVRALSAGRAMQIALEDYPGQTILECFSGNKEPLWVPKAEHPTSGYWAQPAWVDYEIPPHKPALSHEAEQVGEETIPFSFFEEIPATVKPRKRVPAAKERTHV